MATALQAAVVSRLTKRQQNSLAALQNKVENGRGYVSTVQVSAAQQAALQAAWDAGKASGIPLTLEAIAAAARLGLK